MAVTGATSDAMAGLDHTEDYGDYAYYGDYDYDDGSLGASDAAESGTSSQRSRQVVLVRRSLNEGFGFTLRHFIAYPDDYEQDGAEPGIEPQETIFVSGVVPAGPAHLAGLRLGDRVLNVNGLPVWDLSYADVVYQVQLSGLRLSLRVVPRDDDEVQRAWGDTAHHPASNLNMKQFSHLPRPPPYRPAGGAPLALGPLGALGQAAVAVAAPHFSAEDSSSLNGDRSSSSRRPSMLSLQMPPSASVSSVSGAGSGGEHADANDPVYSRIRKDVETKQQFLSRPTQPWPTGQPQTPVVREYHVNPTRFPRPPWPPEAPGGSGSGAHRQRSGTEQERRLRRQRGEPATAPAGRAGPLAFPVPHGSSISVSSSTDSLASAPGGVPNATARPYAVPEPSPASGSPEYVQYDAVTQVPRAKLPPPEHKTHIVSKRARQFETGCLDNDTYAGPSCYRSELGLIAESGKRPSVRLRRSEFERDTDTSDHGHRLQSVMSDPELDLSCCLEHRPLQHHQQQQQHEPPTRPGRHRFRRSYSCDGGRFVSNLEILLKTSGPEDAPRRPPRSGIGNRMVIVGGPRLHAEPLNEGAYRDVPQKKPVRRRPEPELSDSPGHTSWPFPAVDAAGRPLSKISEQAEQETSPENERKRNSAELIAGKMGEQKQKDSRVAVALRKQPQLRTLRQPSYLAAVKTPTPEARPSAPAAALTAAEATDSPAAAAAADTMLSSPSVVSPHHPYPRPRRPDFLPLSLDGRGEPAPAPANAAASAAEDPEDSVLTADPDTKSPPIRTALAPLSLEPGKTSTPNSLVGVVRRQKPFAAPGEDDTDRTVRRISYRKATGGDGVFPTGGREDRSASTRITKPSSPTWPVSPPATGPAADATREGWLRVKLATVDGKRAPDRSWRELWAVLRGDALSFYRDRKEVNQTPSSLEEQPVNVALCQLDPADDYTRRKHVFRLLTHTRSEYLLQTEHLLERESWLEVLRPICQPVQHQDASQLVNESHLSPAAGIRAKLPNRQRSPTGLAPGGTKGRKHSQTPEQTSDSPKSKSWKGRMKRQILRMQHAGGSPQMPPAAPVPDGATLGVPLELCPPSESNPFVPRIVEMCTGLVEERGLDSEGIYRVPGNNAAIKSLSEAVNRGIHQVDLQADPRWTDVNVISSLLKSFFRKLPDSLVTSDLYPKFIDASKLEDPEQRRRQLRELVGRLPDYNYETLKHLLRHLRRVTDPVCQNKMDLKNMAIVFGPTLVRSSDDSASALVTDMSQQCGIVKTLISEFDYYFPADEAEETAEEQPPPVPDSSPPLSAEVPDGRGRHGPPLFSTARRVDSQGSPLDPKDVVSSIIFAASRKAQQDGLSERDESGVDPTAARSPAERGSASECNNNRIKPAHLSSSATGATDAAPGATHRVHVIPIQLVEEAASASPAPGAAPAAARLRLSSESAPVPSGDPAGLDDTAIRSYTGLSQTTEERIRRFEEETKAMLQRDKLREREARDLDLQRQRIEREWARAKQDLEHPDFLDELADNPADIARRIAELSTRLPGLAPSAAVTAGASSTAADADRDERLSVTSEGGERRPPPAWDTVSSGYSTMSSAGTGPRPGRARADSLPLRSPATTAAAAAAAASAATGCSSLAPARPGSSPLQRDSRRSSESGERARWLAPSSRLYRSPRPVRRGGSAEDLAAAQTRKVELKRSEKALKARAAGEGARAAARHRSPASRDESSSADESADVSAVSEVSAAERSAGPLASHEGCDLVTSLMSTLDQKMQELGGRPAETEKRAPWSSEMYRDPSLHRSYSASCQLQMMNVSAGGDRPAPALAAPAVRDAPRPLAAELTKKGMKRSIRQLCEKFEQRAEPPRAARAAPGSPRAIKRRHTVGGSKDIDKVVRLFLAASRAGAGTVRPASCLVELDLLPLQPVPLESRV